MFEGLAIRPGAIVKVNLPSGYAHVAERLPRSSTQRRAQHSARTLLQHDNWRISGHPAVTELEHCHAELRAAFIRSAGREIGGKWLELLHEIVPGRSKIAALWNPSNDNSLAYVRQMREIADGMGVTVLSFELTVNGATLNPGNVPLIYTAVKVEVKQLETESANWKRFRPPLLRKPFHDHARPSLQRA